jgi:hypothetical protein
MVIMKPTAPILAILTIFLSLFLVPAGLAHGSEPRLELGAERLYPGGALEIRGVDFEAETAFTLFLIGPGIEIDLGEVTPDVEGGFNQVFSLPADLPEGLYHIQAVTSDHDLSSPEFTVLAGALPSGEQGEQRQEEESLLAPIPTIATVTVAETQQPVLTVTSTAPMAEINAESDQPRAWWPFVLGGLILVGIGFAAIKLLAH